MGAHRLPDHDERTLDTPRPLDEWESGAVKRILSLPSTPPALREAAAQLRVDSECRVCPTVSLLVPAEVARLMDDAGLPMFAVAPGTLTIGDGMSRTHVMIHINEGFVNELQVYRDDGEPVGTRPILGDMVLSDISWDDAEAI